MLRAELGTKNSPVHLFFHNQTRTAFSTASAWDAVAVAPCCCDNKALPCPHIPILQWGEKHSLVITSAISPWDKSSRLTEIWWQTENAKKSYSRQSLTVLSPDRGTRVQSDPALSLFTFPPCTLFFLPPFFRTLSQATEQWAFRVRWRGEAAQLDGEQIKCVRQRSYRSRMDWDNREE